MGRHEGRAAEMLDAAKSEELQASSPRDNNIPSESAAQLSAAQSSTRSPRSPGCPRSPSQPAQPVRPTMSDAGAPVVVNICDHFGNASTKCPPPESQHKIQPRSWLAEDDNKKYLADCKRCWPPPIFIIWISLLEVGVYVYDCLTVEPQGELNSTSIPSESLLIYRPDRRLQLWRFVSYTLLHANGLHLGFNVAVQLLYGLPLELVHGSARVAAIYLAGVVAGSLGTSVVDSEVYLVGASGGVYALLAAHLANVSLNYGQMRYGLSQLVSVLIFVSCDAGYAFYTKYLDPDPELVPSVSYIAHLAGSLAGFSVGLLMLRNFEAQPQSKLVRWVALGAYAAFTVFAIVFNLVNTVTAQLLEEEGEVVRQRLLRDLGIS